MMFPLRDRTHVPAPGPASASARPCADPTVTPTTRAALRAAGPRLMRLNRRAPYMDAPHRSCAMASALSRSASLARHVCTNG